MYIVVIEESLKLCVLKINDCAGIESRKHNTCKIDGIEPYRAAIFVRARGIIRLKPSAEFEMEAANCLALGSINMQVSGSANMALGVEIEQRCIYQTQKEEHSHTMSFHSS
jgi:hypothetical protein